jgi:hypothetical protein
VKAILTKVLVACLGLVTVSAPLAASAQGWHDRGRGGDHDERRHDERWEHRRWEERRWEERRWQEQRWEERHRERYVNGYYGRSPYGYDAYYSNGAWYPHRRWQNGVFIYFRL